MGTPSVWLDTVLTGLVAVPSLVIWKLSVSGTVAA